jgi:hypothetical protein
MTHGNGMGARTHSHQSTEIRRAWGSSGSVIPSSSMVSSHFTDIQPEAFKVTTIYLAAVVVQHCIQRWTRKETKATHQQ